MRHVVKPLPFKPHQLQGLSAALLENHYQHHYGVTVQRLNAVEKRLSESATSAAGLAERFEMLNLAFLHELYFSSLGGSGTLEGELLAALERDFGSVAGWRDEFITLAKAAAVTGWC